VELEKFEYRAKVKVKLTLYRLITCKVRYFKTLFVIIVLITDYRYENLFTTIF